MITVRHLLEHYDQKKDIAAAFDQIRPCSKMAVTLWGMDKPIPPQRELDMRMEIWPGMVWPADEEK